MSESLRSQRYEGLFQSQTREMFDADARRAAEHDWYPKTQEWNGAVLFVQYEHDPGRRLRVAAMPSPFVLAPPPVPPNAQTPGPGSPKDRPASGRRRRVMVGVVVGLIVAAVVATTLIGTQVLSRPATGSQAETPAQTQAPVVAQGASLGARTTVVDLFKARGFSGAVVTLVDGREQWRGTDGRGSVAEVIGSEERVTEVSMAVNLLRGEKRDNKARNADLDYLMDTFAPLAAEWSDAEVDATDASAVRTVEETFGDLTVKLVSMPVQGGSVVKFQIKTD